MSGALYEKYARKGVKKLKLLFSPELLRESVALYDNLYPSRIIVGYPKMIDNIQFKAEAVKLFANTYLALRVSYFNELDTYPEMEGLDTQAIISGVGLEPRIGHIITTQASVMVVIVCLKIQSNCWPTIKMYLKT